MLKIDRSTWLKSERVWSYFINTDYAVSVVWPKSKDVQTSHEIAALIRTVHDHYGHAVIDYSMGFHSCLFYIDKKKITMQDFISYIDQVTYEHEASSQEEVMIIPLSTDENHALDLAEVSASCDLTPAEVLDIFCNQTYTVHFQGFLPGFTYIGGLDARLHLPRRSQPRVRVPAGSVAIAAGQIGIYPVASPGGWHIIGHTRTQLFDISQDPPSRCHTGMKIRFSAES